MREEAISATRIHEACLKMTGLCVRFASLTLPILRP